MIKIGVVCTEAVLYSFLVSRYFWHIACYFLLAARCLLIFVPYLLLVTFYSLLFAGYILLVTCDFLLFACYFLFVAPSCSLIILFFLIISRNFLLQLCTSCSYKFKHCIVVFHCQPLEEHDDDKKLLSFHSLRSLN